MMCLITCNYRLWRCKLGKVLYNVNVGTLTIKIYIMSSKTEKYELSIEAKKQNKIAFKKGYNTQLHEDFVQKTEEKKHNLANHSKWFTDKIKLNHKFEKDTIISKWKIVLIDFGMNVGTEINGVRPALVYKASHYKYWEDVVVLPITSFDETKSQDVFDIKLDTNLQIWLKKTSLIKTRQIRAISKKRVRVHPVTGNVRIVWKIKSKSVQNKIDENIRNMFSL